MSVLIENVISNPYALIILGLSLAAALGFIVFLRGILSGLKHLTNINENAEELAHTRTRAVWGVILMAFFFGLWETIQVLAAILQDKPWPPALWILILFFWPEVILALLVAVLGKKGGGH
jgi:hypothetical protein